MNDIFSNLLDVCVMIYLDDILIYSNNMFKHYWHVKKVFKCLHKAGVYAKAEKCKFYSELVEYLGYILSPSSLTMSNNKVKIIQDFPESKKVNNIQVSLTFIAGSSSTTQTLSFYWHISSRRMSSGSSTPSVMMLSTPSRKHSPLLLFSLIGFLILNSS